MESLRTGRQKYYNLFSHVYDLFIKCHATGDRDETRKFLVEAAELETRTRPKVLDICCGTGSVILSFVERFSDIAAIGYDFSIGMLTKAREKDPGNSVCFVKGDAVRLSFADNCFDVVCCSHALYELKGAARKKALAEMRRVVKPNGRVLIMEHEVPRKKIIKMMFNVRMKMMGAKDSHEFVEQGLAPYRAIFNHVSLSHTRSGKSKLILCRK